MVVSRTRPGFYEWVASLDAGDDPRGDFIRDTREAFRSWGATYCEDMLDGACAESREAYDALRCTYDSETTACEDVEVTTATTACRTVVDLRHQIDELFVASGDPHGPNERFVASRLRRAVELVRELDTALNLARVGLTGAGAQRGEGEA